MPSELKSDTTRTAAREKSSRNSLSRGLTSRSIIILECENSAEFHEMLANYRATYQPATAAESDLVDQMACARWRVCRTWSVETALLDNEILRNKPAVEKQFTSFDVSVELAQAFRSLADNSRALDLASRFASRLILMHDRAYRTLRELQRRRESAARQATPGTNQMIPKQIDPESKKCETNPRARRLQVLTPVRNLC